MTRKSFGWIVGLVVLSSGLFLFLQAGSAETNEELKAKIARLEAELQQLKTEYGSILSLTGTAKEEIKAIGNVLAAKPGMAFDFSTQSGEYCMSPGSGDMTHYAVAPEKTQEDIIYMLNPKLFIENGLKVDNLPKLPLDKAEVKPGQWYYYAGDSIEPHHQRKMAPMLIMSINVK
jgi:hypothetical protein